MSPEFDIDEDIREPRLIDFIYNEGSSAHRGVWHVTDNADIKVTPAQDKTEPGYSGRPVRRIHPEYRTIRGDAICGQVRCSTGGLDYGRYTYESKGTPDEVFVIKRRARRPNFVRTTCDKAPGPLCSRCARKAKVDC